MMFNKVLIAEDHEIRNLGVIKTLEELQITDYEFVIIVMMPFLN